MTLITGKRFSTLSSAPLLIDAHISLQHHPSLTFTTSLFSTCFVFAFKGGGNESLLQHTAADPRFILLGM
jgi:hypothetical protein